MSCVGGEWGGKGYVWESRDYDTEYGVSVELIDVSSRQARVKIYSSFAPTSDEIIAKGANVTLGDGWTVHCDDVVESMVQAKIRICRDEDPTPPQPDPDPTPTDGYELPLYGSTTVFGWTFTNTRLLCATSQAVIRPEGLTAKTLVVGGAAVMWAVPSVVSPVSLVRKSVIMGGIYVALKSIDSACTKALVDIFESTYTTEDHNDVVSTIINEVGSGGSGEFTDAEIEDATTQAEENVKNSDEYLQIVEDVKDGKITPEEGDEAIKQLVIDETMRILYEANFDLSIPPIVMAGDIDISGTAPQQNQIVKIMVVKKLLGFDWAAADTELDTVGSDGNYEYYTTITLDEFGVVDVYAMIGKDWWAILDADITTEKHTVLVLTPMILLALLAMLAMVLDKKYNFIGMFKKKRGKK